MTNPLYGSRDPLRGRKSKGRDGLITERKAQLFVDALNEWNRAFWANDPRPFGRTIGAHAATSAGVQEDDCPDGPDTKGRYWLGSHCYIRNDRNEWQLL